MKNDIHPQYSPNAKVKCACGNEWTTGSTMSEISTGICSKCHPFYTGQEKILDTRGRVDKFKRRLEKSVLAHQKLSGQAGKARSTLGKAQKKNKKNGK